MTEEQGSWEEEAKDPEIREASDAFMVNFLSLVGSRFQEHSTSSTALTANQLLIRIRCQIKAPKPGSPSI